MRERYKRILDAIKSSPVKIAIVKLLKDSPNIFDTLRGLASWAFVPVDKAAPEVQELVTLGVLQQYGDGPGAVYRFTTDEALRECLNCNWEQIEHARAEMRKREL